MTSATLLSRAAHVRRTQRVDVLRLLLTALALIPYALGWLAGAVVTAAVWVRAALMVGWQDGRRTHGEPPG